MKKTITFHSTQKTIPVTISTGRKGKTNFTFKNFLNEVYLAECMSSNRGVTATSFFIFFVVLMFTYPKYLELTFDNNLNTHFSYFFDKVADPLKTVQTDPQTHGGKIDFRFTVPLLAKILGVTGSQNGGNVILIYLIQSALLVPFIFTLIKLLLRKLPPVSALLFASGSATIYLAKSFFWDYDFWFDGFAYFFLLLGMYLKNRAGIFVALTSACWTDERAVVALASIYLFHLLSETDFELRQFAHFRGGLLLKRSSVVLLVGSVYLVTRLFLSSWFGLHTPTGKGSGVELGLVPYQLKYRVSGVFLTFEGFWILFLTAVGLLIKRRNFLLTVSMLSIMIGHVMVAYSVYDISRSLTYAFPLIIISAFINNEHKLPGSSSRYLYMGATAICVLLPTQYVIFYPRQIPWTILSLEELKPIVKSLILFGSHHI